MRHSRTSLKLIAALSTTTSLLPYYSSCIGGLCVSSSSRFVFGTGVAAASKAAAFTSTQRLFSPLSASRTKMATAATTTSISDNSNSGMTVDQKSDQKYRHVAFIEGRNDNAPYATHETSKQFLISQPSGAYTTARTCSNRSRIFEWEAHVERTAASVKSMMLLEEEEDNTCNYSSDGTHLLFDPVLLRPRLDAAVALAVRSYEKNILSINEEDEQSNKNDAELKITVLVEWKTATESNDNIDSASTNSSLAGRVLCHVTSLPVLPDPPVRVEIRGSPRNNAAAKDSAWISDRAPLEKLMADAQVGGPINELLLTHVKRNNDGDSTDNTIDDKENKTNKDKEQLVILEGSQTNFYAIMDDGKVYTASAETDGILAGTVRTLVLDVCKREKIPVVYEPPCVLDASNRWEGALISSTSRLALPIDELYMPPEKENRPSTEKDLIRKFDYSSNNDTGTSTSSSLAIRIQKLVAAEVEARSTAIKFANDSVNSDDK